MKQDELLQLAKTILKENKTCALSGSLAINLQKIKTRNEPGDIDIYVPIGEKFVVIEGMIYNNDFNNDFNRDDYRDECYERHQYIINSVKVDVFNTCNDYEIELNMIQSHGIKLVRFDDIIKFKIRFAFDDHSSAEKHNDDVTFMLRNYKQNNILKF